MIAIYNNTKEKSWIPNGIPNPNNYHSYFPFIHPFSQYLFTISYVQNNGAKKRQFSAYNVILFKEGNYNKNKDA